MRSSAAQVRRRGVKRLLSRADLTAELDTEGGQDRYLLTPLAVGAHQRRGLHLDASQIYAYAPSPIVTGGFDVDRIEVFGFVAVVNTTGQLHGQLRNEPS